MCSSSPKSPKPTYIPPPPPPPKVNPQAAPRTAPNRVKRGSMDSLRTDLTIPDRLGGSLNIPG